MSTATYSPSSCFSSFAGLFGLGGSIMASEESAICKHLIHMLTGMIFNSDFGSLRQFGQILHILFRQNHGLQSGTVGG